jgi:uncharacterized protein (TIGR02117 family)
VAARALFRVGRAGLALAGLAGTIYALAAWIGSSIPANPGAAPARAGVAIMVESNGIHTGIIVPVANAQKDWRGTFPSAANPRADGQYPTHIAIGWGEREVFLHTARWTDIRPATVLRIATTGGKALVRVAHYARPVPGENHRQLILSQAQYARLAARIEAALPAPAPGGPRRVLRGSYSPDAFYEARGEYTLFNTCNTFVGDVLADAGVPMGRWTPLAGGVMKWVPPAAQPPA